MWCGKNLVTVVKSLNIYDSSNVIEKLKYNSIRKVNWAPDFVNFVSYKTLSGYINKTDIGVFKPVSPELTTDVDEDEIYDGMFREILSFNVRLAEFYVRVNQCRKDKLKEFE